MRQVLWETEAIIVTLRLIDSLLTVSVEYLYSTLKVVTRPLNIKYDKAALQPIKVAPEKSIQYYTVTLMISNMDSEAEDHVRPN